MQANSNRLSARFDFALVYPEDGFEKTNADLQFGRYINDRLAKLTPSFYYASPESVILGERERRRRFSCVVMAVLFMHSFNVARR